MQLTRGMVLYPLLTILVLAPLPLGSNREWAWTLLAAVLAALTIIWAVLRLVSPPAHHRSLPAVLPVLFLAACVWAALQASSWLPAEWHHPLWSLSAEVLGPESGSSAAGVLGDASSATTAGSGSVSLAPDDTLSALLRLLSGGLAFWLAFQCCQDRNAARRLVLWLAVAAVVQATYGLLVYWSQTDRFLWFWLLDYQPAVRGTFVNRNSFATWLGLGILCILALFYERMVFRRNPVYRVPSGSAAALEKFLTRAWLPLAAIIIAMAALVLTHSRGGFFSSMLALVVLLLLLNHRQGRTSLRLRAVLAALLPLLLLVFVMTSDVLLKRMDNTGADAGVRLQAYELAIEGIGDNAVLGFGYGTFADSFRLYRDESIDAHLDMAHNTYLENVFELGWPAALALFASIAGAALLCLRGALRRGRDWVFPATAFAATVLVACHALVDFSLQMPATAVAFAALLGMGCAQARSSRHGS